MVTDLDEGTALLASPVRRGIVDALDEAPRRDRLATVTGLTASELADRLGRHVTTIRFHLDRLVSHGLVEGQATKAFGVGRPRKVYTLVGNGPDAQVARVTFERLTSLLAETYGASLTPEEAGHAWVRRHLALQRTGAAVSTGEWIAKVGGAVEVLQQWGYRPELSTSDGGRVCTIDLARCPFEDVARANQGVVCGIHRGLLTGVLHEQGEDDVVVTLKPFSGPRLCQAVVVTGARFDVFADDDKETT